MRSSMQLDGMVQAEEGAKSRYVQLIVNGTYGDETMGATVAEFAVL